MTNPKPANLDPVPKIDSLAIDDAARLKLKEAWRRVESGASARIYWDRHLTPEQRKVLGGDLATAFKQCKGTTNMALRLKPMFWARAIILLARDIGHLSETDYHWLSRTIRAVDPTRPTGRKVVRRSKSKSDPNRVLEKALRRGAKLILIQGEGERRLLWRGQADGKPWGRHGKLWELLWKLAEKARIGEGARWDELTRSIRDRGGDRVMKHRRYRLKALLSVELDQLIVSQASGYKLKDMGKSDLVLIELQAGEYLDQ